MILGVGSARKRCSSHQRPHAPFDLDEVVAWRFRRVPTENREVTCAVTSRSCEPTSPDDADGQGTYRPSGHGFAFHLVLSWNACLASLTP